MDSSSSSSSPSLSPARVTEQDDETDLSSSLSSSEEEIERIEAELLFDDRFPIMRTESNMMRDTISPMMSNDQQTVKTATGAAYTVNHTKSVVEVHIDPEKRPSFANITDDYQLLDNLLRYAKFCENFNVPVPQMAQSLARAIGIQNGGKYSVLVYDYLLAIPEYPPTQNGRREPLYGPGRFCNMVCYKSQLFGVVVFPASENVTFYFNEFSSFSPYVQQLIFTYGNKNLRFCPEKRALAFDFKPEQQMMEQSQAILLTATLQRKMKEGVPSPQMMGHMDPNGDAHMQQKRKELPEYIQLE